VAELMHISSDELLQELMASYVLSVRESVADVASKYPVFGDRYPFVETRNNYSFKSIKSKGLHK
jgi:hypothetical protein